MQIKSDQLILYSIKKCHTMLFDKQIKGNDFQFLETTLVPYPLNEIIYLAIPVHGMYSIKATIYFETSHFRAIPGVKTFCFAKKMQHVCSLFDGTSCRMHHDL